jgi:hypothetical protein
VLAKASKVYVKGGELILNVVERLRVADQDERGRHRERKMRAGSFVSGNIEK